MHPVLSVVRAVAVPLALVIPGLVGLGPRAEAGNWPQFRGPNAAGVSADKDVPVQWTDKEVLWKTSIPGLGYSSPVIWGDHVFLTTAEDWGQHRSILCLAASDGGVRWVRDVESGPDKRHPKNSFASATPATDGQRVYVAFSTTEQYSLFAYDFQGTKLWRRDLGPFISQHGSGTSPIVFEDLVILGNYQGDPDQPSRGSSFVIAVDRGTGAVRWRTPVPSKVVAYATPIIITRSDGGSDVIFTSQDEGIAAFDARTGARRWNAPVFAHRTVGSPVFGDGLVFASSGQGGMGTVMAAVRPGGRGDVSATHVVWILRKQIPYVPSPIFYQDHLYLWNDKFTVRCLEARTGKPVWVHKIEGTYSASPVCIDGKLYGVSESGEVRVVAATPEGYHRLGRSSIGERCEATPAVADGRLFIRGAKSLFCIGGKRSVARGPARSE